MEHRVEVAYASNSQKYILTNKTYTQQFSHLYNRRLGTMKRQIRAQSIRKWGEEISIMNRIIDSEINSDAHPINITNNTQNTHNSNTNASATSSAGGGNESEEGIMGELASKEYVLMGTLYKQMPNRPSVLDEYTKDSTAYRPTNSISSTNITSENDVLLLEDETGRIALTGAILAHVGQLSTGIVVAVRGRELQLGEFTVSDWVFAGGSELQVDESASASLSTNGVSTAEDDSYTTGAGPFVLFVSGFEFGSPRAQLLAMDLLADFVAGRLGEQEDIDVAKKICRVVIAGDSVNVAEAAESMTAEKKQSSNLVLATKQFDAYLTQLVNNCPVLLMPGSGDPPVHPCLLPNSSRFSTLNHAPNPAHFTVGEHHFLGHAGQPIADLRRQCRLKSGVNEGDESVSVKPEGDSAGDAIEVGVTPHIEVPAIDLLNRTLLWGHLCPTCPDTLPCYPFLEEDIFITPPETRVDVLFAGNQDKFETSFVRGVFSYSQESQSHFTRTITVPSFARTQQAILLDLSSPSLRCFPISFSM